jgi:hypothetical protein
VFVLVAYAVVKYVPPAKVTVSPLTIVSVPVSPAISQAYIPLIADQVLSPLKYLVLSGVPAAERSNVPKSTSPIAEVAAVKDINVP